MNKFIKNNIYYLPKLDCKIKFIEINKTYSIDLFEFIIVNTKNKGSRLILCDNEVVPLKNQEAA